MNRVPLIILSVVIIIAIVVVAFSLVPPPAVLVGDLALESVQEGLAFPVSFAFAPDGRIFFNELRDGGIRIVKDGTLLPTPFASLDVVRQGERGLLGLALPPNFAAEPYVYVFYTYQAADGPFNRIARFPVLGDVAGAEEILVDRLPSGGVHNSGRLQFGPDGMLYASLGDTGDRNQAQDLGTLPGSILRIHLDGGLPTDNPFPGSYTYLYGIRNVFGLQFSPGGVLLFTDNGQTRNDEVNRGLAGGNFGWPVVQGDQTDPAFESPLVVFTNRTLAPTGIAFYTGDRLGPAYAQAAYFGSWVEAGLRRLVGDVERDEEGFTTQLVLSPNLGGLLDVVDGPDGYLYVSFPDRISRVIMEPAPSMTPTLPSLQVAVAGTRLAPPT